MLMTVLFLLLTICILTNSSLSLSYASLGLELWFQKMVPSLFPFMILSGIMVRLNLTERLAMAAYPLVGRIYRVRKNVCYCMLLGFLCGFPMGAKVTGELFERGQLTHREAEYLLAFCNNIGPVYFCSFVLPLLGRELTAPYLFGMYGIPLLYGLVLRGTVYHNLTSLGITPARIADPSSGAELRTAELGSRIPGCRPHLASAQGLEPGHRSRLTFAQILEATNQSIQSSGQSILTLGGYMILFNLLNLLPHVLAGHSLPLLSPLLEITGGLGMLKGTLPLYSLLALSFGGLSCIAQTYSCIRGCGLSLSNYIYHKVILTMLSAGFYLCWFLLLPGSFLR